MKDARVALAAAIAAAAAVAVAPAIPSALRAPLLILALAAWTAGVAWATFAALRRLARERPSGFAAIGLAGIALAVIATTELGVLRVFGDRPALTWNVDWRYALNHAQAIARTGGLESALDYAGAPIEYHVGPAWLAGAADRVLGGGLDVVLFGLVPLLCALTWAVASVHLLRSMGVGAQTAVGATGMVMALPGIGYTLPLTGYCLVLGSCRTSPVIWTFSHEMVLNTFQALAVGLAALALLFDRESRAAGAFFAAAGLAAIATIKPQSFLGFGALAGVAGIAFLAGIRGFTPRTPRVVAAAIGGGVLGAALLFALPHVDGRFARPVFAPGATEFPFNEDRLVPTALAILALIFARRFLREHERLRSFLYTTAAVLFPLAAFWAVVAFPVRPDVLERMLEVGADTAQRADFAQSLQPLRLVLALAATTALIGSVPLLVPKRARIARGIAWAVTLSPIFFIGFAARAPLRAYEADEDVGLLGVLEQLPEGTGLLIASDLADAAEDYRRPLRGFALTAYTGRPFYVSNLQYGHHAHADAAARMQALRAFFGSAWSPWHSSWLAESGISGILVSTRCLPAWYGRPGVPLRMVARNGRWTALVPTPMGPSSRSEAPAPEWREMTPAYGRSDCLTGGVREPGDAPAAGGTSVSDRS